MKKIKLSFVKRSIFVFSLWVFVLSIYAQESKFDSIANLFDRISYSQLTKSIQLLDTLYSLTQDSGDSLKLTIETLYREAELYAEHELTDATLDSRIKNCISPAYNTTPFEKELLLYSQGLCNFATENYSEAFSILMKSLSQFRLSGNDTFTIKTLRLLGGLCSNIYLFDLSNIYYTEALEMLTPDDVEYFRIKQNMYRLHFFEYEYGQVIDSLTILSSQLNYLPKEESGPLAAIYLNLGSAYYSIGNMDMFYHYLQKTDELIQHIDNPKINAVFYLNMGVYVSKTTGDPKRALDYFFKAKPLMEENGNMINLSLLYETISSTYETLDDDENALFYLKKYKDLSWKLIPSFKTIELNQRYILTSLETSEKNLIIAEQKVELRNKQVVIISVMLALTILLISTILMFVQQQKKQKENENRFLKDRYEHEIKIQLLEKEKQEETIEVKKREITSYSLLLSNKNHILKQIDDLNTFIYNCEKEPIEVSLKIKEVIKNNFNVDEEWKDFKCHFEEVHPSFFDKLKNFAGNLTEENLRLCAYFKIGMSTKQIAQILNIEPRSVFKSRTRLKKKLGLEKSIDLDSFIRNI